MLAFTFFSLFGVALALYFRHTVYEPKTYKYQLTAFGVRYTEEENIPEFMYKAVRVSAYFGIVLCLVAGLIAGPLIFIGGGAFALMAFKMTGFEKAIAHESFFWHHTYDIRIHRKSGTVNIWPRNPEGLELNCFSYYGRRTWSNPQDIDEIIAQIRALGIKVNVIEFERLRDV
ncbi:hypothetical protein C9I98_10215 [Photobacterium sanctipauli]|uniref:Uncharacterized protein n=2 Tax=Photobacterium sanctipauli TaxID=1342794 RepID=A0A2T3NUB6_9GAMM|nr:hypothetical protein C9I98_10215 [Photobacterium sanctipauli]